MNEMKHIKINKNRGWRGLAEVKVYDEMGDLTTTHIFSFSQPMWDDLIKDNIVVIKGNTHYHVIHFSSVIKGVLPRPLQQRSVLIKNFTAEIDHVDQIPIDTWTRTAKDVSWSAINHFISNRNNHTTSDWNCIGVRVIPEI